jgi:hypothetical protein
MRPVRAFLPSSRPGAFPPGPAAMSTRTADLHESRALCVPRRGRPGRDDWQDLSRTLQRADFDDTPPTLLLPIKRPTQVGRSPGRDVCHRTRAAPARTSGRDLGLLVAEHEGHQPAGHVEALLLASNRLKTNANDAASSARSGSRSRSSATHTPDRQPGKRSLTRHYFAEITSVYDQRKQRKAITEGAIDRAVAIRINLCAAAYSYRRASIGSLRLALRAGRVSVRNAINMMPAITRVIQAGVSGL